MNVKRLTLATIICAFALTVTAQEQPRCKIESSYDRFTDNTRSLCTIQTAGKLSINAVAIYKGKRATDEAQYSLLFSYFDKDAFPDEHLKYDKAETLFILAGDLRRQVPLSDYKSSNGGTPLRGRVIHIENMKAELDRETWQRLLEAKKTELRFGETEIEITPDARALLHNFTAQVEQP